MNAFRQRRGAPNGQPRPALLSNASSDFSRPALLNGQSSGNLPQFEVRPTVGANYVRSSVEGKTAESEVDTSRPWTEQMSKSGLAVTTQSDNADTSFRRSCRQQSQAVYQDLGAELVLKPRNIRKKLNFKSNLATDGVDEERARKRARREAIECECHITIWDNRENLLLEEALAKRTQTCYLIARDGHDNGQIVDFELTEPIIIKAAELQVSIRQNGRQSRGIGDKYFLEMKIIPCREEGDWPPIPILSRSEGELFAGLGKPSLEISRGALVARYMHLPQAPAPDVPLSVFFVHRGRAYKTKYGLEVNGAWVRPTLSEVRLKLESKDETLKLASWALDEDGDPFGRKSSEPKSLRRSSRKSYRRSESEVEVSYVFDAKSKETSKATRKATLKGFCCPACRIGEFENLGELQFHLINSHHKYKFDLESEEKDPVTGELKVVSFIVNSADVKRAKDPNNLKSEWEWNWNAPQKPFDLDAYVKGDHSWVGIQTKKRGPPPPVYSSDPTTALRQKNNGFLPADVVPELPEPKRKKYAVVETRTRDKLPLFTSISHRQLRLSEEPMSESDDDMDSEWLKDKHMQTIDQVDRLSGVQKDFRKKWDRHRMDEGLGHPRYLSDSLVRFVKKHRAWLRANPAAVSEFLHFAQLLKARRVVDDDVVAGCHCIIFDPAPATTTTKEATPPADTEVLMADVDLTIETCPPETHGADEDLTLKWIDALHELRHRGTEKFLAAPPGSCGKCSTEIAKPDREAVLCSNDACTIPAVMFHPLCAGPDARDPNWLCELCKIRAKIADKTARAKGKEVAR